MPFNDERVTPDVVQNNNNIVVQPCAANGGDADTQDLGIRFAFAQESGETGPETHFVSVY